MRNHPEHVENIRETIGFGYDLSQQVLGLVELTLLVMLSTEEQELLDVVVHAPGMEPRSRRKVQGLARSESDFGEKG
jgi:hypothetical protein